MDIRRIEQFLAVHRHGGFGRAAGALVLSQPALTRGVAALEADLGTKLFDRGPRGAVLTSAGERFLPHARAIVADYARAVTELDPGRAQERRQVRVGVSPNFLHSLLPEVLATVLARSPQTNVQVTTGTAERLRAQLRTRDIDLAMHVTPDFPLTPSEEAADLTTDIIGAERVVAVAAADDPLPVGRASLEALSLRHWATPHQMSLTYRFESVFHRRKLPVPVQGFNGASLELALHLVLRARLLGMLPEGLVDEEVARGRLRRLDCPELDLRYAVALVRRRSERSQACLEIAAALEAAHGAAKPSAQAR